MVYYFALKSYCEVICFECFSIFHVRACNWLRYRLWFIDKDCTCDHLLLTSTSYGLLWKVFSLADIPWLLFSIEPWMKQPFTSQWFSICLYSNVAIMISVWWQSTYVTKRMWQVESFYINSKKITASVSFQRLFNDVLVKRFTVQKLIKALKLFSPNQTNFNAKPWQY